MTRHAALLTGFVLPIATLLTCEAILRAHSGPPFPVVSNQVAGAYEISVWTDPDSTDDGSAGGQFWVVLARADRSAGIPDGTRVHVAIHAMDRRSAPVSGAAAPANGLIARQFVALPMDHEGPFGVHVTVDGPLGHAEVDTRVDATYDVRPAPFLLAVFAFPFVAVGVLWFKVLLRRRRAARVRN